MGAGRELGHLQYEGLHPFRWSDRSGGRICCDDCRALISIYRVEAIGLGDSLRFVCREHPLSPEVVHPRKDG